MNFLSDAETELSKEYTEQGYIIRPVADMDTLHRIRSEFFRLAEDILPDTVRVKENILNKTHEFVDVSQLNDFRLQMIESINGKSWFRQAYYQLAMPYLHSLVGNELSMQMRVNLSIQLPGDSSSLLPTHADTWSGDSPFEVVVWLPLVDCYDTKSMYLLPPEATQRLENDFEQRAGDNSETLFNTIKGDVKWLRVDYGNVLIFNQTLPHGNRVNHEEETRWSMNCRFKSVFSPYGDKKLGEFFEPVTLRAVSRLGLDYKLPIV